MSLENIIEDNFGQVFEATVTEDRTAVDISVYTESQTFVFRDPDGNLLTKDGEFTTDGSDGKVQFLIEDGDFDEPGIWKVQVKLEKPSSDAALRTIPRSFKIKDSLDS